MLKQKAIVGLLLSLGTMGVVNNLPRWRLTPSIVMASPQLQLEIVARLNQAPGNITVTPGGRIIVSMHQFFNPVDPVMEVKRDGTLIPFPDSQRFEELDTVLGIQSDSQGTVWMLDNGLRGGVTPKLVGWNTNNNDLERVIYLPPPITVAQSFLNDLAVDLTHQAVYIADTASHTKPALIVVDLQTGLARRVLEGHQSTLARNTDLIVEGNPVVIKQPDGSELTPRVGLNPIALDQDDQWLYYGPMSGDKIYRIKTADLLDKDLNPEQLASRVEEYGNRPNSDGISIDEEGNIYISDINHNGIGVVRTDGSYQRLVTESWLSWPNAFSFGPDGYMYCLVNQLHLAPPFNQGEDLTVPPFLILRFRPLAPGKVGR